MSTGNQLFGNNLKTNVLYSQLIIIKMEGIKMVNKITVVVFFSAFFLGCTTINHKVFNGIDYAVEVPKGYMKITSIEIRRKGKITTLEELMPALKESVSEMNFVRDIIITNVKT